MAGVLVLLYRRLMSPLRRQEVSAAWLSRFSVARYRPMERLFAEEDYEFLTCQRGYHPGIARQLRRQRRRVFRSYLDCLKRDFGQLEAAIKMCMVTSCEDRPDLAKALLKRRLVFTYAVLAVECRLVLCSVGLGKIDVCRLVSSLDGMRTQLGQVALARQASLA